MCWERGPAGPAGGDAGLQTGPQVFPVRVTRLNQALHEMWRRAFLCFISTAPFASRVFTSIRGKNQNVRISLFGGNCRVSLLCCLPWVRHDKGEKTQPPEPDQPPQPLRTHQLMVLGFCAQKQPEENYCPVSLVHWFPKCVECKQELSEKKVLDLYYSWKFWIN